MLTQLRINVTNIYSASLSLSNFFENVFHFKPDRRFWVVVSGVVSIVLMLGGILDYLGSAMTFQGVLLMAWAAILVTDALVVKKLLKIGPKEYEARQEKLYKWNPAGVVPLMISSILGTIAGLGYMGTFLQNTATFFAAILASVLTITVAVYTKGKYYSKESKESVQRKKEKERKMPTYTKEVPVD